ncbi:hypothetical protein [Hoeflea sp.]|uniref:hypothetical protein n=1 Tax=Hoeflea sp. TaxID=1940281 RepID=UPI003A8D67AD
MLLLILMLRRPPHDRAGKGLKADDGFMEEHGGWEARVTFQCFQAVSDLLIQLHELRKNRR